MVLPREGQRPQESKLKWRGVAGSATLATETWADYTVFAGREDDSLVVPSGNLCYTKQALRVLIHESPD
jgi:hypothetical protein